MTDMQQPTRFPATPFQDDAWVESNQKTMVAELATLADRIADPPAPSPAAIVPAAIDMLAAAFDLSGFERALLLLCAGAEMDSRIAASGAVTFARALATLDSPHWSALAATRPLRRWRMIEIEPGATLTTSPLRIDERILHFLAGLNFVDLRLAPLLSRRHAAELMPAAHADIATSLAQAWQNAQPPILLFGDDSMGAEDIAAAIAARSGFALYTVAAENLPTHPAERDVFATLWQREAVLLPAALLIQCGDQTPPPSVPALATAIATPLLIATRDKQGLADTTLSQEVRKPTATEQRLLWSAALGSAPDTALDDALDVVAAQFRFSTRTILRAARSVRDSIAADVAPADALWRACRGSGRSRLDDLANRIEPHAGWDDLVLPSPQQTALRQIAAQVRQRDRVYRDWAFATRNNRGLGIAVLFSGESGTGKTLAAEVLAAELRLDLYRIDLSAVVSKYIGESEKNLRIVFDAAEDSGAILLFDEADALFGKRSDVKDSHDRYANIEVSYLLQRMEAYRGLAILTTNLKSALDPAFQRRLRFIVHFPFPDAAQREEIWRRAIPSAARAGKLDFAKLARLNASGGTVRNIALNAAFLAAESGEQLAMHHLLAAAHADRAKQERPLADSEVRGWA